MHITNYQMHNVLKVYTNHLSRKRSAKSGQPTIRRPQTEFVRISAEAKRQNIIDRVSADIVARITKEGIDGGGIPGADTGIPANPSGEHSAARNRSSRFEYNVLDGSAEKKTNTLSVDNVGFLIQRIEELTGNTD